MMEKFGYPITAETAQDMVEEMDWDGDDKLNFDEFCKIMMGKSFI